MRGPEKKAPSTRGSGEENFDTSRASLKRGSEVNGDAVCASSMIAENFFTLG
jgi:hypothetical protein